MGRNLQLDFNMTELAFPKQSRLKDPKLLQELRELIEREVFHCVACNQLAHVFHHVITVGSGGPDEARNLAPLCTPHHDEIHRMGTAPFARKYGGFEAWLRAAKWTWDPILLRWSPPF